MRVLVATALAAGVVVAAGFFAVALPARHLVGLRHTLREQSKLLDEEMRLLRQMPDPQEELRKVTHAKEGLAHRFPDPGDMPTILGQLGELAGDHNVEILSLSPAEVKESQPGTERTSHARDIVLEMQCDYESLAGYLKALRGLPTFFSVEAIDIDAPMNIAPRLSIRLVLALFPMAAST